MLFRSKDFSYTLPDDRVAKYPLNARDESKLLVYKNGNISEDVYHNIGNYLQPQTLLLFNNTRVIDTFRSNRYTEEGKFLPWAMRIAHNLCVDHFRRVKRTPVIKTSDNHDIFEVLNFNDDNAEQKMMKNQSYDRIRRMLDLLPEEQREVIVLRHYADLSFKEIASLTNCSINTALGRMRYGLINLRKMMMEKQISL